MNNHVAPIPVSLAQEIARQGEVRLSALMSLATAADLRATTLCGIFGAASVGIGAAVLTYLASEHPLTRLIIAGSVTCGCLFFASLLAAISGAPRDFFIGGGNPDSLREWSWDKNKWREDVEMFDATAQRQARSININIKILEKGSKRVNCSLIFALSAPMLGLLSYFIAGYFF